MTLFVVNAMTRHPVPEAAATIVFATIVIRPSHTLDAPPVFFTCMQHPVVAPLAGANSLPTIIQLFEPVLAPAESMRRPVTEYPSMWLLQIQ
jgi:hypothetical protein